MNLELPETEIRARVENVIDYLEIGHLRDKPVHLLSYGEKKRVSIADIVVMEPEVLIFDEPTSSLDPKQSEHIITLLDNINRNGKTVILSTHDVNLAYSWADEIIVMKDGEILKTGTPIEIFSDDELLKTASLKKPFVLETYSELVKSGILTENIAVPLNEKELYRLIKN